MPEKYKKYIFYMIAKDIRLWRKDYAKQIKVLDKYKK